ncbi:hypothetical protein QL285_075562 [Trifolium repens]|nr:hypothetical protein QL285_075562 [Trifolium repens]
MAEKKTMRDCIMGNQERTAPKRKTLGEYIIESKLDAMIKQLETLMPSVCECCGLVGHKSQDCQIENSCDDYDILPIEEQNDPHSFKRDINYIPPCLRRAPPKPMEEPNINEALTTLNQNTISDFSQRPQDSMATCVEPNLEEEAMPKRITLGEWIIEAKLKALRRKQETFTPPSCTNCSLVGHYSQDCPIGSSLDDYETLPNEDQHDLHPPNRDINYIPPCLRRTCPKQAEEPNINETRTTLRQSTITELFQRYQDSISTHIQPNFESKAEVNLLTSGVDLKLRHEGQVLIESEEALTEESTCEEQHKQDMVVVDIEKSKESPFILGQTILTIGDVVIEVHKGKVNLRCGNKDDVLKALNSVENFSHFISSYFDNVVVTNNFSDLRMQAPMEKSSILQNFCIVADVIDEAIESVCALLSHNQLGKEWTPYHMYQKFMEFLPNQRKKKDDVVYVSFWPP